MCAQAKLKVTIQFHQAVGVGVEGQTAWRQNGHSWWENSICGAATKRYSLRLMMGDWEAVHEHQKLPQTAQKVGGRNALRRYRFVNAKHGSHEQVSWITTACIEIFLPGIFIKSLACAQTQWGSMKPINLEANWWQQRCRNPCLDFLSHMLCHQIVTLVNKNPQKFNCSSFYMKLLLSMKFIIFPVTQSWINKTIALSYHAGGFRTFPVKRSETNK